MRTKNDLVPERRELYAWSRVYYILLWKVEQHECTTEVTDFSGLNADTTLINNNIITAIIINNIWHCIPVESCRRAPPPPSPPVVIIATVGRTGARNRKYFFGFHCYYIITIRYNIVHVLHSTTPPPPLDRGMRVKPFDVFPSFLQPIISIYYYYYGPQSAERRLRVRI